MNKILAKKLVSFDCIKTNITRLSIKGHNSNKFIDKEIYMIILRTYLKASQATSYGFHCQGLGYTAPIYIRPYMYRT